MLLVGAVVLESMITTTEVVVVEAVAPLLNGLTYQV
jgi:hypothetical protein